MSIRALAIEVYRAVRLVEELEKKLQASAMPGPERAKVEELLRQARAERDRIKALLQGAKED